MEQALEQRIRQRAYEIWDALGRPEGNSDQHWLIAEREILAVSVQAVARPIAKKKRPTPRKPSSSEARPRSGPEDGRRLNYGGSAVGISSLANGACGEHRRHDKRLNEA